MTVPGRLRAASDADPAPSVHTKTVRVDGFPLSARVCSAPSPRAVIFALHGGGTTSLYFDCPGRPEFSLLRTGAQLGYAVVAMDRPGYGISTPYAERYRDPQRRLETTYAAMERFLDQLPGRPAVFVAAHSAGCELAMRMAADPRGLRLLGLEIAGTGLRHQPATIRALEAAGVTRQRYGRRPAGTRETLWGPAELYAEDVWNTPYIASDSPLTRAPRGRGWSATSSASRPRCGSRCSSASATTSGCGSRDPRRSPRSQAFSPPLPVSGPTNRRDAATT